MYYFIYCFSGKFTLGLSKKRFRKKAFSLKSIFKIKATLFLYKLIYTNNQQSPTTERRVRHE